MWRVSEDDLAAYLERCYQETQERIAAGTIKDEAPEGDETRSMRSAMASVYSAGKVEYRLLVTGRRAACFYGGRCGGQGSGDCRVNHTGNIWAIYAFQFPEYCPD
jgi:hypothetical protein